MWIVFSSCVYVSSILLIFSSLCLLFSVSHLFLFFVCLVSLLNLWGDEGRSERSHDLFSLDALGPLSVGCGYDFFRSASTNLNRLSFIFPWSEWPVFVRLLVDSSYCLLASLYARFFCTVIFIASMLFLQAEISKILSTMDHRTFGALSDGLVLLFKVKFFIPFRT